MFFLTNNEKNVIIKTIRGGFMNIVGRYTISTRTSFYRKEYPIAFNWQELLVSVIPANKLERISERFAAKTKLPLPLIDLLTTQYDNEDELVNDLKRLNPGLVGTKIVISYQSKRHSNYLLPIYANEEIKKVALRFLENNKIDNSDPMLYNFARKFSTTMAEEKHLEKYLLDSNFLSKRVKEFLYGYWEVSDENFAEQDYRFKLLVRELNHYKTIRGLQIGINEYFSDKERIEEELTGEILMQKARENYETRLNEARQARENYETRLNETNQARESQTKPSRQPTIEELKKQRDALIKASKQQALEAKKLKAQESKTVETIPLFKISDDGDYIYDRDDLQIEANGQIIMPGFEDKKHR